MPYEPLPILADGEILSSVYENRVVRALNDSSAAHTEAAGDLLYTSQGQIHRLAAPAQPSSLWLPGNSIYTPEYQQLDALATIAEYGALASRYITRGSDNFSGAAILSLNWRPTTGGPRAVEDQMQVRIGDLATRGAPRTRSNTAAHPRTTGYGWDHFDQSDFTDPTFSAIYGTGIFRFETTTAGTYNVWLQFDWRGAVTSRRFYIAVLEDTNTSVNQRIAPSGWGTQTIANQIATNALGVSGVATADTPFSRGRAYTATIARGTRLGIRTGNDQASNNLQRAMVYVIISI